MNPDFTLTVNNIKITQQKLSHRENSIGRKYNTTLSVLRVSAGDVVVQPKFVCCYFTFIPKRIIFLGLY